MLNNTVNSVLGTETCNFEGKALRIAVSQQPPLVDCAQDQQGDWICDGSNIEIIRSLENRFSFKAHWLVLADAKATEATSDALAGVIRMLQTGRAWMSANGFMETPDRLRDPRIVLSNTFDYFKLHFLLSKTVRDHDHIFIKPFDGKTWLAILFSAILIVPILYLVDKSSYHYYTKHNRILSKIPESLCIKRIWSKIIDLKEYSTSGSIAVKSNDKRQSISTVTSSSSTTVSFCEKIDQLISLGSEFRLDTSEVSKRRADRHRKRDLIQGLTRAKLDAIRLKNARLSGSSFSRVSYIIWYVVASLATQGGETEDLPSASSTRVLVAFWWFYLIVIGAIHSGVLTAILTFPRQNDFIQTLDDFLALSQSGGAPPLQLSVDQNSETALLLAGTENLVNSPLQALFKLRPKRSTGFDSANSSIIRVDFKRHRERILNEIQVGKLTMIEERAIINAIITSEYLDRQPPKCQFKISKFPIDTVPMSLIMSKLMPKNCRKAIDNHLNWILRVGLAQKWRRKHEVQGNDCLNTVIINAGDVKKIGFAHVELAFWLILVGLLLGFGLLVTEVLWLVTSDGEDEDLNFVSNQALELSRISSASGDSTDDAPKLGHKIQSSYLGQRKLKLRTLKLTEKSRLRTPRTSLSNLKIMDIEQFTKRTEIVRKSNNIAKKVVQHQSRGRKKAPIVQPNASKTEVRGRRWNKVVTMVKHLNDGKLYQGLLSSTKSRKPFA